MSKKEFLLQVINTFESAENLPNDLQNTLEQIKQELYVRSEGDVEAETTSVVTNSAAEEGENPEWLSALLYQAVKKMEEIAQEREDSHPELLQACNMLRGELGMAIDPPFP